MLPLEQIIKQAETKKANRINEAEYQRIDSNPVSKISDYLQSVYSDIISGDEQADNWKIEGEILAEKNPAVFIENLIGFLTEKATDIPQESKEAFTSFTQKINEIFFNESQNIIRLLSLKDLLRLGAIANLVPEIQGWFGKTVVQEITYTLSFMDEKNLGKIPLSLKDMSLPERLNIVNFLQTVAADAISNGSWARPALKRIEELLKNMKSESKSPFMDYALDLTKERIQKERLDHSLTVIMFKGNKERGRLSEPIKKNRLMKAASLPVE
jgi:hypothetical protein